MRTVLAVMWLVIAGAAVVRLVTGSEWFGTVTLLGVALVVSALVGVHAWRSNGQ
jgi:hypothetical protein